MSLRIGVIEGILKLYTIMYDEEGSYAQELRDTNLR